MPTFADLVPPIIPKLLARVQNINVSKEPQLFDGEGDMFKRLVSTSRVYGEYGVGVSTDWVYANTNAMIVAVESSGAWAEALLKGKDPRRISIGVGEFGEIGELGRPVSFEFRANFPVYMNYIWAGHLKPDTVLVDGRFRVCCFVTSVLQANAGCRIIFDDYCDRPEYHLVEELLKPVERCGRQALFEVPEVLDRTLAEQIARDFKMVMD